MNFILGGKLTDHMAILVREYNQIFGKSGNKFPTKKFCTSVFVKVSTNTPQKI